MHCIEVSANKFNSLELIKQRLPSVLIRLLSKLYLGGGRGVLKGITILLLTVYYLEFPKKKKSINHNLYLPNITCLFICHLFNIYCMEHNLREKRHIFCPHSYFSMGDMQVFLPDIAYLLHCISVRILAWRKLDAGYLLSVDHTWGSILTQTYLRNCQVKKFTGLFSPWGFMDEI